MIKNNSKLVILDLSSIYTVCRNTVHATDLVKINYIICVAPIIIFPNFLITIIIIFDSPCIYRMQSIT